MLNWDVSIQARLDEQAMNLLGAGDRSISFVGLIHHNAPISDDTLYRKNTYTMHGIQGSLELDHK